MCGINGIVIQNKKTQIDEAVHQMNTCIIHRGPDDEGLFSETNEEYSIAFGMRRLSVIDLHSGSQPIYSDDKNLVIVFNGEIYNYKELRQELIDKGVQFYTQSDTEVVLQMYANYGTASFSRLDGMFAFSILDKTKNKVFIARDFFGEKPLYYFQNEEKLIWASELKSLVKELKQKPAISTTGLNLYFRLTYIPAPYTIYEGIHKLQANHFITFDLVSQQLSIAEIPQEVDQLKTSVNFEDAKLKTKELLSDSVRSRMISDVPFGAFLSGGVDSSIISLLMAQQSSQKIDTFSIGFEKKSFDESEKARTVAKLIQSNHHEFILKPEDLQNDMHRILLNFDEPFADSSALPSYFVALKTKQHVTVALTGDGGDEMYGGYNKYLMGTYNKKITGVFPKFIFNPARKLLSPFLQSSNDERGLKFKINRVLNAVDHGDDYYLNIISLGLSSPEIKNILKAKNYQDHIFNQYTQQLIGKIDGLTQFRKVDKILSLEGDMLVKVDRTSMLASLECRAPFLNKKIWNYNNQLPEKYLLNGSNKKFLLKESFKDQFPENFLEKSKKGFGVPVGDWLRAHLKEELLSYADPKFLEEQQIFNVAFTTKMIDEHLSGTKDQTFSVWSFYCFQLWYVHTYQKIE